MAVSPDIGELMSAHRMHDRDTGSTVVQIIRLTTKISALSEHCVANHCDKHALLGLVKLLSKRRRLLKYLARLSGEERRDAITKLLGIKK